MTLFNERGEVIRLGAQISKPGGEGTVYEVASNPSLAAKHYHTPLDGKKTAKIQQLCRVENPELLKIAALPRWSLFASNVKRIACGFIMHRVVGKEIHSLYGPRDRWTEFPAADWDFLIHVARICAAAFETLHANGVLMADVNEKNLLVTSNGRMNWTRFTPPGKHAIMTLAIRIGTVWPIARGAGLRRLEGQTSSSRWPSNSGLKAR